MSSPRLSILDVFNRYRFPGGEEYSAERIRKHLSKRHDVSVCQFESHEWTREGAPSAFGQAWRLFYNPQGRERFESTLDHVRPDLAIFHNIYPVGSPALYHAALKRKLPVVQFLHNYRPFAVGGTLYSRGRILPDSLHGNYLAEVREGAWMGSVARSALMAVNLKMLHRSGWLKSVRTWIAISEFMRRRLIEAGAVAPERIVTLRHAYDTMAVAPPRQDAGYYLFLGRLVAEKGIPMLLDAWDALYLQLGKKTPSLHIAGDGPLASVIIERARSNPYLCLLGSIGGDTKAEQLARCRGVVIPSTWWEPLGLVTYEAYDYSKPVLAARSGGLNETVLPGVTGLSHEPGNVDELVRDVLAIESMSMAERDSLGAGGRAWLRREADPGRWLQRFEEIAHAAIEGAPALAKR